MDIPMALNEIRPGEEFVMDDYTDYETLVWRSDTTKPTKEEVVDGWNLHLNKQYQRDRKPKYPPIEDQLDMIYHAGLGGDEFQEAIKIIKNKYPK